MLKKIFFTSLALVSLNAQEKYQINAINLDTKDDVIIANDDVVIFSKTYYMTANKVIYNKAENTFELFDDVTILKDNQLQLQSDYAFVDMDDESIIQKPSFLVEKPTNLWIDTDSTTKSENEVILDRAIVSSCNCEDPFWSIQFSEANYDVEDQWLDMFNTRLYIKNIPVFYTPYFGFSTNTNRRTGLLYPTLGQSKDEGFLYSQPIFIAPSHNYDIELVPEIRTSRGVGLVSYFRYADSKYSMLKVESGIFAENNDYADENNLRNNKHYGFTVDYRRTKLFAKKENHQDGLFLNANWLNDVDYSEVYDSRFGENDTRTVESILNYFYSTPEYYFGTYLRYYLDTSLESNDTTIQQLPQVQLHQFTKPFIFDNLLYSTDLQYTNYSRQTGLNVQEYNLNLPIQYGFSLFDDFLYVTVKEEFALSRLEYEKGLRSYNDGTFLQNRHIVEVGTDLLKPYENYLHTLNLSSTLSIPNTIHEDGDLFSVNTQANELSTFPIVEDDKSLSFALNHSLYDRENLRQIINHKVSQKIVYNDGINSELGDFENEITLNYGLGRFYSRIIYNHQDETLTETSSSFDLSYNWFGINANHYKSKKTQFSGKDDLESYSVAATTRFSKDYWLTYQLNYNLEEDIKSREAIILTIDDDCWRFNISFQQEQETTNTTSGIQRRNQDVFYLELELKPLGGIQEAFNIGG